MTIRYLAIAAWWLCLAGRIANPSCDAAPPADQAEAPAAEFDARVAPILARRCLECHNATHREGNLDLTRRDSALSGGDSGPALVPGNLDESFLWQRVVAGEMPPDDHEPLSRAEREVLQAWIAGGAKWGAEPIDRFRFTTDARAGRDWWAFQPIERPEPPAVKNEDWPRNDIDRFILARLEAAGIEPSPEADRRTLIRRLHFDLIGLPPSPEEIDAFIADESPDAYDKLVDRLLSSPHYGERWARHWLDVVRFGESSGFQRNWLRPNAWKYRDWVILALDEDMPYDEFVRRQLAGDVLHPDDPSAIAATGYLVAGPYDVQGEDMGSERMRRQSREEEIAENVATLGQTFLGLTIHCARCHDHKFDPISQRDFYQVAATLAGFRHNLGDPREVAGLAEDAPRRNELQQRMAPLRDRIAVIEGDLRERLMAQSAAESTRQIDRVSARLARSRDELRRLEAAAPKQYVDAETGEPVPAAPSPPWWRHPSLPQFAGAAALAVVILGMVFVRSFRARVARRSKPWVVGAAGAVLSVALVVHGLTTSDGEDDPNAPRVVLEVVKDQQHTAKEREAAYIQAELAELRSRTPAVQYGEILAELPAERRDEYREAARALSTLELEDALLAGGATYAVAPEDEPLAIHVLERGDVGQPGELVAPAGIEVVFANGSDFGLSPDAPEARRRRKLADWIADPANPLPPRVMVNRVWQHHFGRGIVATPSDFGFSGTRPSHPELLDWLAAEFLDGEQRLKALHRTIVTSATYRQSSMNRPAAAAQDADTALLWRKPPLRHEAEALRDAVLSVAGLLSPQVGGPGYRDFEYQPRPETRSDANYRPIEVFGPRYFRRTIYRTWVRGVDNTLLSTLECPDPSVATPQRSATTTPLQALSLFNDASMVAAARAFAQRLEREAGSERDAQVVRGWRLAFGRDPAPEELDEALAFLDEHPLHQLCLVLFNANEFVHAN
ncbi:MAG: DUF1549 domain-containing protein [Planctomycetaceae bacterium]